MLLWWPLLCAILSFVLSNAQTIGLFAHSAYFPFDWHTLQWAKQTKLVHSSNVHTYTARLW